MAIFKKSLFIIFAFVLAFASFVFIPQNKIQATYATSENISNTYNYDDSEIIGTNNSLVSSSIDSVEYVEVDCVPLIKITFTNNFSGNSDGWVPFASYYDTGAGTNTYTGDLIYVNILDNPFQYNFNLNWGIICDTTNTIHLAENRNIYQDFNGTRYYSRYIYLKTGYTYTLYLTNLIISKNSGHGFLFSKNEYTPLFSKQVIDNTNYLVDFDSETNFTIDLELDDLTKEFIFNPLAPNYKSFYLDLYDRLKLYVNGNINSFDFGWLVCGYRQSVGGGLISTDYYYGTIDAWSKVGNFYNSSVSIGFYRGSSLVASGITGFKCVTSFGFSAFNLTSYNNNYAYIGSLSDNILYVDSLYVSIRRPSKRVNNSLNIYNFDYNGMLSSVNKATYQLRLNNDYYNVNYNGSIPNEKYMVINNDNVNNILFDEYVLLYFEYDNNLITTPIDYASMFTIKFGFDFNFTYYTEPLVLNNGVYNLDFKPPLYKDGRIGFSLAPPRLDIPFDAWVYNAVVFLCFYCPLVKDVFNFIKLDYFMLSLLNIIGLYVGSAIGNFINACICFVIFWGILKGLMPAVGSSISASGSYLYGKDVSIIKTIYKDVTAGRRISKRVDYDEKMFNKRISQVKNYRNKKGKMFGNPRKYERHIKKSR